MAAALWATRSWVLLTQLSLGWTDHAAVSTRCSKKQNRTDKLLFNFYFSVGRLAFLPNLFLRTNPNSTFYLSVYKMKLTFRLQFSNIAVDAKICHIRGLHFSSKALKQLKETWSKETTWNQTNPIFKCFQPCFKTALLGLFSKQPSMKPSTFEIWFSYVDISCFYAWRSREYPSWHSIVAKMK